MSEFRISQRCTFDWEMATKYGRVSGELTLNDEGEIQDMVVALDGIEEARRHQVLGSLPLVRLKNAAKARS